MLRGFRTKAQCRTVMQQILFLSLLYKNNRESSRKRKSAKRNIHSITVLIKKHRTIHLVLLWILCKIVGSFLSLHLQIQIKEKDAGVYKKEIEGKSAIRLTDETAASYSHHLTSISISTIQKELGIVNKEECYQSVNAM